MREKIVTVTQDVLVPFEKIVEVPVDKVVYRDKIVTHTTEVPVDRYGGGCESHVTQMQHLCKIGSVSC